MRTMLIGMLLVFLIGAVFAGLQPGESQIAAKTWYRLDFKTCDSETEAFGFQVARGYFVWSHQFTGRIGSKFNIDIFSSDKREDKAGVGLKIKAAYLEFALNPDTKFQAGVIKNYFGTVYDWDYTTIEKALEDVESIEASADVGVALAGYIPGGWGTYNVGIYNGEGYKAFLKNIDTHPDFRGNIRFIPVSGLTVGGSASWTQFDVEIDTLGNTEARNRMDIAGLLRFAYGPVDIWGEYLMVTMDETTGSGLMAMPTFILTDRIQLIARYDMWDPNGDVEDDGHSRMIAGANYFISKNAKGAPETQLQVNWERTTPEAEDLEPIDQFMIQLRWEFKSNPF